MSFPAEKLPCVPPCLSKLNTPWMQSSTMTAAPNLKLSIRMVCLSPPCYLISLYSEELDVPEWVNKQNKNIPSRSLLMGLSNATCLCVKPVRLKILLQRPWCLSKQNSNKRSQSCVPSYRLNICCGFFEPWQTKGYFTKGMQSVIEGFAFVCVTACGHSHIVNFFGGRVCCTRWESL